MRKSKNKAHLLTIAVCLLCLLTCSCSGNENHEETVGREEDRLEGHELLDAMFENLDYSQDEFLASYRKEDYPNMDDENLVTFRGSHTGSFTGEDADEIIAFYKVDAVPARSLGADRTIVAVFENGTGALLVQKSFPLQDAKIYESRDEQGHYQLTIYDECVQQGVSGSVIEVWELDQKEWILKERKNQVSF